MRKSTFLFAFILIFFISCNKEDFNAADDKGTKKIATDLKEVENKINEATHFINAVLLESQEQSNHTKSDAAAFRSSTARDVASKQSIDTVYDLRYQDGSDFLKLICYAPSGYALISVIEDVPNPPVLFYSKGKFDEENVNPGLVTYIEEFVESNVKNSYAPPDYEDENGDGAWDDGRDTKTGDPRESPYYHKTTVLDKWTETTTKGPFLSRYWDQGPPFNNACPIMEGAAPELNNRAPAGCVAIAIGQIMNYHKKNAIKNYDWVNINARETPYISEFIRDIGDGVGMRYGPEVSSAYDTKAVDYFKRAGYNANLIDYDYALLKSQIDRGNPVYLSGGVEVRVLKKKILWFIKIYGQGYTGGHSWVADGYKEVKNWTKTKEDRGKYGGVSVYNSSSTTKYVRMNWGWGKDFQKNNDWCTYDYFKNRAGTFNYKKKMIIVY